MVVCSNWLGADYFVRNGFTLAVNDAGNRTVTRDHLCFEIGRACDHPDCPPLITTSTPLERTAA